MELSNTAMLDAMNAFIRKESLLEGNEKLVLAVSGGIDSVVMAELFRQRGQNCIIAHCNFGLRAEESEADEQFSKALSDRYGMPFFSKRFDTATYAEQLGISIQMAARDQRYEWFSEIAKAESCSSIALAHHLDDQAETFLMRLARGSGLRGLSGIPVSRAIYIRPLMFARRKEIMEFAMDQGLEWREDVSNDSNAYLRNRIRHDALPLLEEIMPSFTDNLLHSVQIIRGAGEASAMFAASLKKAWVKEEDGNYFISIPESDISPQLMAFLLYEWLSPFGFNHEQARQALEVYAKGPGKQICSESHILETARAGLYLLERNAGSQEKSWSLESAADQEIPELGISIRLEDFSMKSLIPDNPNIGMVDLGKLEFPLNIRFRRPGDSYRPLGMHGNKKLSDLFIDAKLPVHKKESTPIVISGEQICWVAGFRIGEKFKVTASTRKVLILEYHNKESKHGIDKKCER